MKLHPRGEWFVLYVKSRHEKKINKSLLELSIESYLPLIETEKQWSDRKKKILTPMFPSYVFVKIKSAKDFYNVSSVSGVFSFVSLGKEYAKIREEEIKIIKCLLLDISSTDGIETNVILGKIGEIKKIKRGCLKGMTCEVLKINNKHKIVVRINSLKQNIVATIPSSYFFEEVDMPTEVTL